MSEPVHVLVVAHHTAATPALLAAVGERARHSPATFHLVVPRQQHGMHKVMDPQDTGDGEAQGVLAEALPKLSEAAGREVTGSVGDSEPLMAIQDAIHLGACLSNRNRSEMARFRGYKNVSETPRRAGEGLTERMFHRQLLLTQAPRELRRDHHLDVAATSVALAQARSGEQEPRAWASGDARGGLE